MKKWNKKEKPLCFNCGELACSQVGDDRHWYCFTCTIALFGDEEGEIDDTLEYCPEQLEIQSERWG